MAVSPLPPAAAAVPVAHAAAPAAPVAADPAMTVTAAAGATDSNGARDASSDSPAPQQQSQTVEKALDDINEQMRAWSTRLQFEVDPDLNRVVVSVVDSETGDVMRTIPSDVVLRIAKMIVKLQGNAVQTSA